MANRKFPARRVAPVRDPLVVRVKPYTMTPWGVIENTAWSMDQVLGRIPGDFVECGVWKGGNCMLAALKMLQAGDLRDIWMFDTFEGMPEPTKVDIREKGPALQTWEENRHPVSGNNWCRAEIDAVQEAMASTGYPKERVRFIKGKVEETLRSGPLPEQISVLRLDTDWYESTKAELEVLYPRLVSGGILILDDYNYWQGSKKAVDEYFGKVRLHRVAGGACYMVKP